MGIKKKVIIFLVVLVSICSVVITVFAGKAEVKAAASAEDPIIPTNGYLDDADAIYFLRFVFNDSGQTGGLSDDDIINSDFFKMCTGQLAGTEEEMVVIKAFLLFLYPQVNRYVSDGFSTLDSSRARLQTYLEDKCGGLDNLDEEAFNEVRNEALDQVKDGIVEFLTSQLAQKTRIVVSQSVLDDLAAAAGVYGQIKSLPDKVENFVNTVVTATSTCLMPMASEMSGRYSYFSSYLNCRNLGASDDVIFQTAMDYNFLACKNNSGLAAGFINCIPGKVKWTERRHLIEHWAEFVYQLEQKRDGQPIGTIDTSTYYYEDPTADETVDFNWKLYDNGILVIWGEGALSYSRAPWESKKDQIKQVYIHNGITNIGENAFSNYANLSYISLPNSIQSIERRAFSGCTGLTEIVIPDSVTSIGLNAYSGCSGITSVTLSGKYDYFYQTTSEIYPIFAGCTGITHVKLTGTGEMVKYSTYRPECLKYAPWNIASAAGNEVTVEFEEGITSVSYKAFSDCTGLTEVDLPSTLETIAAYAFYNCKGLTGIDLPGDITSMGEYAFGNCSNLEGEFAVPAKVTKIPEYLLVGCTGITGIDIHDGVTEIGRKAFSGCTGLTEIVIPDSVTSIGLNAYSGCSGITSVTLSGKYDYFYQTTSEIYPIFAGCTGITYVKLTGTGAMVKYSTYRPECLKYAPWNIASAAGNEVTVEFEEGITSVSYKAFSDCTGLTEVDLPSTLEKVDEYAFNNCTGLKTVAYHGAPYEWSEVVIRSYNEPLLRCAMHYHVVRIKPDFVLPKYLQTIEDEAFIGITTESIMIEEGVSVIGNYAFANCPNLKQIVIPESVVNVGENVFEGCNNLVIYGVKGSAAEIYADKEGYLFIPINSYGE